MYNINIRNCGLLRYGTVQSKWSAQTMWPGLTASIMMACVDRHRMFLQNIHNNVCTRLYGVLTQITLQILTTVSTSNPVPKIIKNWNIDGNVTLGKLNYIWAVYTLTQYLTSHTFPTDCTLFYIVSQKTEETNHFQYKYTFYNQHHISINKYSVKQVTVTSPHIFVLLGRMEMCKKQDGVCIHIQMSGCAYTIIFVVWEFYFQYANVKDKLAWLFFMFRWTCFLV